MYRAGILLCIAAFGLHFRTGINTPLPELDFSCDKTGRITITNVEKYMSLYVLEGANRSSDKCVGVYKPVGTGASANIIIDKCAPDNSLMIAVMAFNASTMNLIGGENVALYKLTCYSGGVSGIVPDHFDVVKMDSSSVIMINPLPTQKAKLGDDVITMTISKHDKVIIGESLTLTITGPDALAYVAKECRAFDADHTTSEIVLIQDGHVSDKGDASLMTNFAVRNIPGSHTVSMSSNIHAFHFESGDKVTFKCIVSACKNKMICGNNAYVAGINRRKRNVDVQEHILNTTINVRDSWTEDRFQYKSSGYSKCLSTLLIMFLIALWIERLAHD